VTTFEKWGSKFPCPFPAFADRQAKGTTSIMVQENQETDWSKILFIDEKMIDLDGGKLRMWTKNNLRPTIPKQNILENEFFVPG
jgi:hypothetical protein